MPAYPVVRPMPNLGGPKINLEKEGQNGKGMVDNCVCVYVCGGGGGGAEIKTNKPRKSNTNLSL